MDHPPTHPFPYFDLLVTRDGAAIQEAVEKKYAVKKPLENRPDRVHEYKEFSRNAALITRMKFGRQGKFEADLEKVEEIIGRSRPAIEEVVLGMVSPHAATIHPTQFEMAIDVGEKRFGVSASVTRPHLLKLLKSRGITVTADNPVGGTESQGHLPAHPFPYFGIPVTRDASAIAKAVEAKARETAPHEHNDSRRGEYLTFVQNAGLIAKKGEGPLGRYEADEKRVEAIIARCLPPIEEYLIGLMNPHSKSIHPKQVEKCVEVGKKTFGVAASVTRPHIESVLEGKRIAVTSRRPDAPPRLEPAPRASEPVENLSELNADDAPRRRSTIRRKTSGERKLPMGLIAAGVGLVLVSCGGGGTLFYVIFGRKPAEVAKTLAEEPKKPEETKKPDVTPPRGEPPAKAKDPIETKPKTPPQPPTPPMSGWKEYNSSDGTIKAFFPSMPITRQAPSAFGPKTIVSSTLYSSGDQTVMCMVNVLRFEATSSVEERTAALQPFLSPQMPMGKFGPPGPPGKGGFPIPEKVSEKEVTWLGQTTKEVVLEMPDSPVTKSQIIVRSALIGTTGYVARISGRGRRPPAAYEKDFFEKFEILK